MTPEERAASLKQEILTDMTQEDFDVEIIAAAIRAAENDALERAAIKIIGEWSNMPSVGMRQLQDIAEVVRALKHKEVRYYGANATGAGK
jgi:hypothetical protein